jgi:hypothetical protein
VCRAQSLVHTSLVSKYTSRYRIAVKATLGYLQLRLVLVVNTLLSHETNLNSLSIKFKKKRRFAKRKERIIIGNDSVPLHVASTCSAHISLRYFIRSTY